jgi:hypothetical protein
MKYPPTWRAVNETFELIWTARDEYEAARATREGKTICDVAERLYEAWDRLHYMLTSSFQSSWVNGRIVHSYEIPIIIDGDDEDSHRREHWLSLLTAAPGCNYDADAVREARVIAECGHVPPYMYDMWEPPEDGSKLKAFLDRLPVAAAIHLAFQEYFGWVDSLDELWANTRPKWVDPADTLDDIADTEAEKVNAEKHLRSLIDAYPVGDPYVQPLHFTHWGWDCRKADYLGLSNPEVDRCSCEDPA